MSNIHLSLSSTEPWDTTYRTPEGQVVYKVEYTVPLLEARTIKISKIVPSFLDTTKSGTAQDMRDAFAHLATVEYHTFRSSRIRMGSLDVATDDYFSQEGWSLTTLGRDRVFTGPDGREYRWSLDQTNCKLFVNDSAKTPVARFHRRKWGIIEKAEPASLEIFAAGKNMVDLIVVTGAYMERLRADKESPEGVA